MDFWERTKIDKKVFFNNLNFEVRNKYYSKSDIVGYHESMKNYCSYVLNCFESYCVNREYEK